MTEWKVSSERVSALPPVDGLEVVGHVKPEHPEAVEPVFVRELSQPWMEGIFTVPVVTLSQASSAIAGLRSERITAERDALEAYRKLQAAEARIADLEAAIDSAEIAGGLTENGNLWRFWSQKAQETAGKAEARISSLEEENKRLREALKPFADAADVFATEYPAMLDKPATSCGIRFDALQSARQALEDHNG